MGGLWLRKTPEIPNGSIKINGAALKIFNSYKYLGVMMDKNLECGPQIDYISKKLKSCGALSKLRHCVLKMLTLCLCIHLTRLGY